MKTVEIHSGAMFRCPNCHRANFVHDVLTEVAPDALVPGTDIPDGGTADWSQGWHVCGNCKYELTEQEREPARPFTPEGGALLPAWSYTCDECGRINYTDVTVYAENGVQGPPSMVICLFCNAMFGQDAG